jgi:isopenicillin N synthase-like dioxygenase
MPVASFSFPAIVEAGRSSSPEGKNLLAALDAALIDPGAFRLSDLPLTEAMVEEMHQVTDAFFELPMDVKATYRYVEDQYVGWCGGEFLSQYGSADRKEMFHIGPRVAPTLAVHGNNGSVPVAVVDIAEQALATCALWPAVPDAFIEIWHGYYAAMQGVAAGLGSALAVLLGIDPAEWFAAMQDNWADLAANYYPPLGEGEGAAETVYNAAHRDLTVFTILHQDQSRAGGLSVQAADGSWEPVEPVPGTYVVNVGELLTYLSGGRWRAPPHQVTVTSDGAPQPVGRISVPFFYRPNDERIVRSFVEPDAAPIAVGDWVLDRKRKVASSGT